MHADGEASAGAAGADAEPDEDQEEEDEYLAYLRASGLLSQPLGQHAADADALVSGEVSAVLSDYTNPMLVRMVGMHEHEHAWARLHVTHVCWRAVPWVHLVSGMA